MTEPLQPVDESWSSALAIVAHPDDLEYGTAAAIAKWTSQGKRVVYCLATSGEAGIDGLEPSRCGPLREQEERDGAAIVGVDTVEFLGHPDGTIEYGLPLRRDIARAVRRHRPDVVITSNHHDSWGPGAPNQADHIALGRGVLDGVRDAGNRWVFRELLDEGLEPAKVATVLVAASPATTHAVDVSDHFDAGVASLEAHGEYLRGLGGGGTSDACGADREMANAGTERSEGSAMSDPREFLEAMARPTGTRLGVRFAVGFEVINF